MGEIAKQGSRNVALMYVGAIVGFANTILLYPKVLPKAEYGLITLLIGIAMLVSSISNFGTPNALIRYFPLYRNKETKSTKGLIRYLVLISIVGSILALILMLVFQELIFNAYDKGAKLLVDYYLYIIPLFLFQVFINLYTSHLNVINKSHIQVIQKEIFVRLGQTVLIGMYYLNVIEIELFIILLVVLFGLSLFYLIGYLYKEGEFVRENTSLTRTDRRKILDFSLFTFLSGIARQLSFRIDSIMVGALIITAGSENGGLEAAGIYAVALNISTMLEMPFRALNQSLAPSISLAWAKEDLTKVSELYKKSTETMMVIGVFIALGIWACVNELLEVLPAGYQDVKYVLGWLLLGKLLNVVAGANGIVLMNSPKYKVLTYLSVIGLILTVVSNYIFIAWYEIEGAAMATFYTYLIVNFVIWFLILRYYRLQPFTWANLFTISIGVAILLLVSTFTISNVWVALIFKSTLVTVLFWVAVYLIGLSTDVNNLIDNKLLQRFKKN